MPKTPKEMEKILFKDGWYMISQKGSHRQYEHPVKKGKITIPFHSKDLAKGTENNILKLAQIKK